MVLVELRRGADVRPPAGVIEDGPLDAVETQAPRRRRAQAAEQGAQRRLAAARGALEQDAVAAPDLEVAAGEHRLVAPRVAEPEVAGGDERGAVGGAAGGGDGAAVGGGQRGIAGHQLGEVFARRSPRRRARGRPAPACGGRCRRRAGRPGWRRRHPAARRPRRGGARAARRRPSSQPRGTSTASAVTARSSARPREA